MSRGGRRGHHDHDHDHDHERGHGRRHFPPPPAEEGDVVFFRGGPVNRHFPPPWGGRRMRRGGMRVALLGALQDGPAHGYELMGRLEARSGGRWRPSPGSVYPTLQAMEDEGLVRSSDVDGKRVYELTDAGRTEAAAVAAAAPPWAGMGGPEGSSDVTLHKAVVQLVSASQQIRATGSPELHERAEQIVNEARRKLYQLLAEA